MVDIALTFHRFGAVLHLQRPHEPPAEGPLLGPAFTDPCSYAAATATASLGDTCIVVHVANGHTPWSVKCLPACMTSHKPHLEGLCALFECLCPLWAKRAARNVLNMACIDHPLPMPLNIRFLENSRVVSEAEVTM